MHGAKVIRPPHARRFHARHAHQAGIAFRKCADHHLALVCPVVRAVKSSVRGICFFLRVLMTQRGPAAPLNPPGDAPLSGLTLPSRCPSGLCTVTAARSRGAWVCSLGAIKLAGNWECQEALNWGKHLTNVNSLKTLNSAQNLPTMKMPPLTLLTAGSPPAPGA